jgi:hypothetical protein
MQRERIPDPAELLPDVEPGEERAGCLAHCETCQGEGDVIYRGDHWEALDPCCLKCERRVKWC